MTKLCVVQKAFSEWIYSVLYYTDDLARYVSNVGINNTAFNFKHIHTNYQVATFFKYERLHNLFKHILTTNFKILIYFLSIVVTAKLRLYANKKRFSCFSNNVGELWKCTGSVWHPMCFPKTVQKRNLQKICKQLHLEWKNAKQLTAEKPITGLSPVFDGFSSVLISRNRNITVRLKMRLAKRPFMKFRKDPHCYKLKLECT